MEEFLQVLLEELMILLDPRILHHIKRGKRRIGYILHAEESIVGVEGEPKIIHRLPLKEILVRALKGTFGSVERDGQHVRLARERASRSVIVLGGLAGAPIAVTEGAAHTGRPDFVGPFFGFPAHAHRIRGRLVKDQVGPLVFVQFLLHVVAFGHVGASNFASSRSEKGLGQFAEGSVEFSLGVFTKGLAVSVFVL